AQDLGALLGGLAAPGGQRLVRRLDRAAGLIGAHLRHRAEGLARGRVLDRDRRPVIGIDPFAIDVALLPEQLLVLELHRPTRLPRRADARPSWGNEDHRYGQARGLAR